MNFKTTLLALSIFASTCHAIHNPQMFPQQPRLSNRWGTLKTIAAGALVGSAFGAMNYLSDPIFANGLPWNWFLISIFRNRLTEDIIVNAQENSECVNYSLLCNTAWLSDWIAYLLAYKIMHNTTPWGNTYNSIC